MTDEMVNMDNGPSKNTSTNSTVITVEKLRKHEKIRIIDEDKKANLQLWTYASCDQSSDYIVRHSKGIISHKDEILVHNFPYTQTFNESQVEDIKSALPSLENCTIYEAHEGILLRLFYHSDKWNISTNKKLDAYRSKWAAKQSFGELFDAALDYELLNNSRLEFNDNENVKESFLNMLNKSNTYIFILRNNRENRIVCAPPENPQIYHVATYAGNKLLTDIDIGITRPESHEVENTDSLIELVGKSNPKYIQGLIVYKPDNTQVKLINSEYEEYVKVRGNEQSVKYRYLQVRMNAKYLDTLCYLYPDEIHVFKDYENIIYDIATMLFRSYVQRYIKKNYITLPKQEFGIMDKCHKWHLLDRAQNKITIDKVIDILNEQKANDLNQMIRRFKAQKTNKKQTVKTPKSSILTPKHMSTKGKKGISPIILPQACNTTMSQIKV